ncbi:M48 family metalloprotease [Spartinivicinus poritis]|uniref:M48 family metalloprotease n=1 Tax=Spartinivicinus poritis TaxID=2994640 RepID=A0ABT5U5X7_9GAMM|nr:M48 family metalloprotease [Spartinivicinus sp. A2-2]MDE1461764.1 M48 family metalloprotease [Spartinivicinus sp. A2-2]
MSRLLAISFVLLAALLTGCAVNPATGSRDFVLMSESEEVSTGRRHANQISKQLPIYPDKKLQAYVQRVGQRIVARSHRPNLAYQFTVIDTPDINAFALPGGYIYIHRGLMAYLNSEADLAAVLAHEVGHVTARHSVRQHSASMATGILGQVVAAYTGVGVAGDLTSLLGTAVVRGYGREHELEADRLGAEYLANANYNPQAMINVIGVLKDQSTFSASKARAEGREPVSYHGVFATHPRHDERLQQVINSVPQVSGDNGRDRYLRAINGMAFGDSTEAGVRVGRDFLHKPMGLKITFPKGWKIQNNPDSVVALSPNEQAILAMKLLPIKNQVQPAEYVRDLIGSDQMLGGHDIQKARIRGYSAIARSGYQGQLKRVAIIYYQGKVFLLVGATKQSRYFSTYDPHMLETIHSFQVLPRRDYKKAEGLRVRLTRARRGETFARLAKRSALKEYAVEQLRLLNHYYPSGEPKAGEWLKIVQ